MNERDETMGDLNWIDERVLDYASDDYEDLERVYLGLCLEFNPERYNESDPSSFYWRRNNDAPTLEEVADSMLKMIAAGMLAGRTSDGEHVSRESLDATAVWWGWFKITESGKAALEQTSASQ